MNLFLRLCSDYYHLFIAFLHYKPGRAWGDEEASRNVSLSVEVAKR